MPTSIREESGNVEFRKEITSRGRLVHSTFLTRQTALRSRLNEPLFNAFRILQRHLRAADPPMYRIEYDPAPSILLETQKRPVVVEIGGNLLPKGGRALPQTNRDVGLEIAQRVGIQVPCDVRELLMASESLSNSTMRPLRSAIVLLSCQCLRKASVCSAPSLIRQ
jgi:hypothetical protein